MLIKGCTGELMQSQLASKRQLRGILLDPRSIVWHRNNFAVARDVVSTKAQEQTNQAFGCKWSEMRHGTAGFARFTEQQCRWYLDLYGFASETDLAHYLADCRVVLDCGTGTGSKAAWFASLSPRTLILAVDFAESVADAAEYYATSHPNLVFLRGDIGTMPYLADGSIDYVNCDQVIHHTADPPATFRELVRLTKPGHDLTSYVYRKKALPRELLDEHFRDYCTMLSHSDLLELSAQITQLGRILSEDKQLIDFPAIPALGIEGGRTTLQRFIYWNFIKCFWNEELGEHVSMLTNYDWYSPSQAARYSEAEFRAWITDNQLDVVHFHKEEACYSGRFRVPSADQSKSGRS
jgi:SAM-dependent methyltransferase